MQFVNLGELVNRIRVRVAKLDIAERVKPMLRLELGLLVLALATIIPAFAVGGSDEPKREVIVQGTLAVHQDTSRVLPGGSQTLPAPRAAMPFLGVPTLPAELVNRMAAQMDKPPVVAKVVNVSEADEWYTLKQGDTIYGVAKRHGIPWWKLYKKNRDRLRGECLERNPGKAGLCQGGNWQYRLAVGDQLELPEAEQFEHVKRQKQKLHRVRSGKTVIAAASTEKKEHVSPAEILDQLLPEAAVRQPVVVATQKKEKQVMVLASLESVAKPAGDTMQKPAVHEVAPLPQSVTMSVQDDEDDSLNRCMEKASLVIEAIRAKTSQSQQEMYLVCLKSGALTEPLLWQEVIWLKGRQIDILERIGEYPTDYVCSVREDCVRKSAWLRL